LNGLVRVENDLFFPWLRKLLPTSAEPLFNDILKEQTQVKILSKDVERLCENMKGSIDDKQALQRVADKVKIIEESCLKIQEVQVY
jgi:hypothetical protein